MGSIGHPTQCWFGWQGYKAAVNYTTRPNESTFLGMGCWDDGTGNASGYIEWDVWMDAGTWKICFITQKSPNRAIATFKLNGDSVGTIDCYNAATTDNSYNEITGITVATAGVKTLRIEGSTKNASSSAYYMRGNSVALIKTAGAHSTSAGTDTPGYLHTHIPWMGVKSAVGFNTRNQDAHLTGGYWQQQSGTPAINDEFTYDIWLDAGTYKVGVLHYQETSMGQLTVYLNDVSQGVLDYYGANDPNKYSEITGLVVATAGVKTVKFKVTGKHASSTNYFGGTRSISWIRTGA